MRGIFLSIVLSLLTSSAWAAPVVPVRIPVERDKTYEQNLRWENSADKNVTPAKVMRQITMMRGRRVSAPSPTEFQPIVNVYNTRVRLVAAIAYKF